MPSRSFALFIAMGMAIFIRSASAQPGTVTFWTVEARIATAEQVVVGTIAKVSRKVIVAPGKKSEDGTIWPDGIVEDSITVNIEEVLKGSNKAKEIELPPCKFIGIDTRLDEWCKAKTSFLWFVNLAHKKGNKRGDGRGDWEHLRLGKPVTAESHFKSSYALPVFSMQITPLKDSMDVLECARKYSKNCAGQLRTHSMRIPQIVGQLCRPCHHWNDLIVPIDAELEIMAKRLIESPQEFVPKGTKLDPMARYQLRFSGTRALQHFKSAENATLLRSLVDDPLEDFLHDDVRQEPIKAEALKILKKWEADMTKPM